MERKSKGINPFTMKPSTFKRTIVEKTVDVDDIIREEQEKLETTTVKKPKWYNLAEKVRVARLNRRTRKRYGQ